MALADVQTELRRTNEVEITVTGRKSGQSHSCPVWFVLEGEILYLVPMRGSDSDWYKNLGQKPALRVTVGGKTFSASAHLLTEEKSVKEVVQKFRAKYGEDQVKAYYSKHNVAVEVPLR
jgi:deazaflavin-dependent oxidoreductase (nitroreductase family)